MKKMSTRIFMNKSVYSTEFCDLCRPFGNKIALFADDSLPFVDALTAFLKKSGFAIERFLLPAGEACKTREVKQALEDTLLENGYGRDSLFLALGGGATLDLVGFLASTYMRGVPTILLPTTLLAMADASIGGKTAVDTPSGKNLIGTFYSAKAVWMDLDLLKTLPEKEWLNGLAEVLKAGLIADASIWESLEEKGFDPQDKPKLLDLLEKTIAVKVRTVEEDPEERSVRAILNFGHTVAHAIEQASEHAWPHGQAVAVGCIAESYLSHKLGYLSSADLERIYQLIRRLGYPLAPLPQSLLDPMRRDKKVRDGKIRFVLLKKIGEVVCSGNEYTHAVDEPQIDAMIAWHGEL
jgi:3-dehydroquinate synthase